MDAALRIGVDLGGTKTEAVVVRLEREEARVLARLRVPTQAEQGYDQVVATAARAIAEVAAQAGLSFVPPVGVGMPGSVTYRRKDGSRSELALTKNSNTTCLNGQPFRADLIRAVGRPMAFGNDANCFAIAEATYGAARDARVAFGVIMGTGVGGGIVFRPAEVKAPPVVWDGAQGIAGEWGHIPLDPDAGLPCYCGRKGCIEQYLSGPAIEASYSRRTGSKRLLPEIVARAQSEPHDDAARATLQGVAEVFGRAIATVINLLDPDVIVLGGGVSNLEVLYTEGARAVARWIFNDEVKTRIAKHSLGDSAGVLGAALLAIAQ